jgi:hypothetical protein
MALFKLPINIGRDTCSNLRRAIYPPALVIFIAASYRERAGLRERRSIRSASSQFQVHVPRAIVA